MSLVDPQQGAPIVGVVECRIVRTIESTMECIRSSQRDIERLRVAALIPRHLLSQSALRKFKDGRSDRAILERRLAMAERHVARGEHILAEQRQRVAEMERNARDSRRSRQLLAQFEQLQEMHVADRDRLRTQLLEGDDDLTASPGP